LGQVGGHIESTKGIKCFGIKKAIVLSLSQKLKKNAFCKVNALIASVINEGKLELKYLVLQSICLFMKSMNISASFL